MPDRVEVASVEWSHDHDDHRHRALLHLLFAKESGEDPVGGLNDHEQHVPPTDERRGRTYGAESEVA